MNSRRTARRPRRSSMVRPSGSSIGLPFTVTIIKKPHLGGCGWTKHSRDAFPSLELPSAGSRGPGPHPVLRRPPPATQVGLYTVELTGELLGRRDGRLADVAATHVGRRRSPDCSAIGQERQVRGG